MTSNPPPSANSATPNYLTVLVAGHRPDRLSGEDLPRIGAVLTEVLSELHKASIDSGAALRILTGVAEGADALAADAAVRLGLPFELLIPGLPHALSPAQQQASNVVWLGAPDLHAHGDEAIAIRDEIALAFADFLVVVWDGDVPHGLKGGTVRLAFQAATAMMPVVWIAPSGEVRLLDRTRLTAPCLQRLQGARPEPDWLKELFGAPCSIGDLAHALAKEVSVTLDPEDPEPIAGEHLKKRLNDLVAQGSSQPSPNRAGHLDDTMLMIIGGNWKKDWKENWKKRLAKLTATAKSAWWGEEKPKGAHPIQPPAHIEVAFERADIQASIAAGRHRDATWLIYGASALAVFSAVAGAIRLWPGEHGVPWAITEFIALILIIGLVDKAKNARWHQQWIGQRFVAEQLRYARMGLPVLAIPRLFHASAWQVSVDGKLALASPELWHIQRTLCRQGLPRRTGEGAYLACTPENIAQVRQYVAGVVSSQVGYHSDKNRLLHAVHHRMHSLSSVLFVATALAVPAHFLVHADWLLIFTAFFPALAAAIHGVTTKLEISRLANQHGSMSQELEPLINALTDQSSLTGDVWLNWVRLRLLATTAAALMSEENDQWQQLIGHQDTELPA